MLLELASRVHMMTLYFIFFCIQQISSDTERVAMVIVNTTANATELEVPAIIIATSIVEKLTAAAIDQPEVCHQFPPSSESGLFYLMFYEHGMLWYV